LEVAILRTIVSSFILGTFMSPAFILSFCAALVSISLMGLAFWLSRSIKYVRLSIVGISVIGALAHNLTQLFLAYFILIRHQGIFIFLPWLCIGAIFMGWITGVAAGQICRILLSKQKDFPILKMDFTGCKANDSGSFIAGESIIHKAPPSIKVASVFLLAITVLFLNNFWVYAGLFTCLFLAVFISQVPLRGLLSGLKRYSVFIAVSFFLPALFSSGAHVFLDVNLFKVSYEGLINGFSYSTRIIFLILVNSLLVKTTSVNDLSGGLSKILMPLRVIGICEKRIARIISDSLMIIPALSDLFKEVLNTKSVNGLRNPLPVLSNIIAGFYWSFDAGYVRER